ncbi:BLUF domain-containing protein [Flavivirga spongiicola]|uniref:BLUF domain-containing protein n=1 Tax=Flavivirga spongiicola TaxID=421621 RepID=A0ABU7XVQ0_9FLAO|nr:BLUF domain-containing protein [Flavivirga sp. MEBiC05379]MDO5979851.1 BLUF domain-containing protein [Flavivirga sp. MEBiC05379]
MLKTICYISDSCQEESLDTLKALYSKAKNNNSKYNITGILIYSNSNFLQVLEGDQTSVDATFKRISLDRRHRNIFKVINIDIQQRIFEDYNFGFTIVNNNNKELDSLYEYLEWLRKADNTLANKVVNMVENFIAQKTAKH